MATALTPYTPDPLFSDPSTLGFQKMYLTGIMKDPIVHYNHLSRILTDKVTAAGAGGALTAAGIFSTRNVFNAAASGAWQLPTAVLLLTELYSGVFGGLFPKRLIADDFQSYEALATFRNDTAAAITLTTNTGLTLFPSPITIPANSSVNLIFEVVGSTFATAAFNVYVDGSGGGANAPSSIIVAASGGLESVLTGNTYTVSPDLPQSYSYTAQGPVGYDPATETLTYFGTWDQMSAGGNVTGPANFTTTMTTLTASPTVTSPYFTYNTGTGVFTATVAQNIFVEAGVSGAASLTATLGGVAPNPGSLGAGVTLTIAIFVNGTLVAVNSTDTFFVDICIVEYPVAAGATVVVQVGISTGTLAISSGGSYFHIGTNSH